MEYNVSEVVRYCIKNCIRSSMTVREKPCCAGVAVSRAAASVTNASKWRHVFDLSYRHSNIVMCALYVLN